MPHQKSGGQTSQWEIVAVVVIIVIVAVAISLARGRSGGSALGAAALALLAAVGAAALTAPPAMLASAACRFRAAVGGTAVECSCAAKNSRSKTKGPGKSGVARLGERGFDPALGTEGYANLSGGSGGRSSFCPSAHADADDAAGSNVAFAAGSGTIGGSSAGAAEFDATGPAGYGVEDIAPPRAYPGAVFAGRSAPPAGIPASVGISAAGASAAGEPPMYGVDGYGTPLGYLGDYRETSYANGNQNPRALRAASDVCDNSINHGPYTPRDLLAQVEYDLFGGSSDGDPLGQFAPPCGSGSLRDVSAAELATGDERIAREGTVRNDAARAAAAALNRRRDLDGLFREELVSEGDSIWWGRYEY